MEGSSAQEESLCHESFLYNVLSRYKEYYHANTYCKNRNLYSDRALYSPDIIFEHNAEAKEQIRRQIHKMEKELKRVKYNAKALN